MNVCLYTVQDVCDVSSTGCDTTRSATTMKMEEYDINGTTWYIIYCTIPNKYKKPK